MVTQNHTKKTWTHLRMLGIGALMLLALAACSPGREAAADRKPALDFETQIAVNGASADASSADRYDVNIALGVKNEGRLAFEGDKQFNAQMQLTHLGTDKVRATANVVSLDRIEAGETTWIMNWDGQLDPGRYRLTWGAEGYEKTAYAEFSVGPENVEDPSNDPPPADEMSGGEAPNLDPLLAEARADLATRLDVPASAITLHDVTEAEFPDASLGVPEPGKMYAQVITPGYVIELAVDEEIYTYHAAESRVVFVRAEGDEAAPPTAPKPSDPESAKPGPAIHEGWQQVVNTTYGFAFAYPSDWMTKSLPIQGPGIPDDWPTVQNMMLFPVTWTDRFEQSGPPSPGAPPSYPAALMEVIAGAEVQLRRVYPEPTQSESVDYNGYTLTTEVEQVNEEIQLIRYVIQHPMNPELWIVVSDTISGFPVRLDGNEAIAATVLPIVESFSFTE